MKLLADTHVLIRWLGASTNLSRAQARALAKIRPENPLFVSDISLWEIATLVTSDQRLARSKRVATIT